MEIKKKYRDSNIELCRILCMLMIIGHHCVVHGGGINMDVCTNKWMAYLILPGGKICFDSFIAISAWFLVEQSFKAERFVKVWLEVLFYSVVTITAAAMLGSQFTGIEWFSAFLPITGGVQGYTQTYLAFYLMLPLLTKVSKGMTKKQNIFVIIVMSLFVFVFREMASLIWSEQSVYCRLILFVYIYFLMLYIRRNPVKWLEHTVLMLLVFISGWLFIFGYFTGKVLYPEWGGWKYFAPLFVDEGGLMFVITGLALFFFFKSIKIKPCKWINMLGGVTLAVILIHDGHFFRGWTWALVHTSEWYYSKFYFWRVLACSAAIYAACTVAELARRNFLEKPLFQCNWMQTLCKDMDCFLADQICLAEDSGIELGEKNSRDELECTCQKLKEELERKNNALAELAARYVLQEDK